MDSRKWIWVWIALLVPGLGYAQKPSWVEEKNAAKKAGESVDWKAKRDEWKASKKPDGDLESSLEEKSDQAKQKGKQKVKNKTKDKEGQVDKAKQKAAKDAKQKVDKERVKAEEEQRGKPDMTGKMDAKEMKELDKGAEQGQQSREQRKKWWQFW